MKGKADQRLHIRRAFRRLADSGTGLHVAPDHPQWLSNTVAQMTMDDADPLQGNRDFIGVTAWPASDRCGPAPLPRAG
jgi:hypothetical protein